MVRSFWQMIAVTVCVVSVSCSDRPAPKAPVLGSTASAPDSTALDGLWRGAWGGGERDGVIMQPVIAELLIEGDYVELHGFRDANGLAGTVRIDANTRQVLITPAADTGGPAGSNVIEFIYEIQGDRLRLTGTDKFRIVLERRGILHKPLADSYAQLVMATGINEAGDLLVTEYTAIEAGARRTTFFEPQTRALKTQHASILLTQEAGLKRTTLDEARESIREVTPVVVTYRPDDRLPSDPASEPSPRTGSSPPDSDVVSQTFSRLLRPGTLIFILSAHDNVPVP